MLFGDVLLPKYAGISLQPDVEFRHPLHGTTVLWFFSPLQSKKFIATYTKKLGGAGGGMFKIQWNVIMPWGTVLLNQSLINTIRSSIWKQKCYPHFFNYFSNTSHNSGLMESIIQISLAEATVVATHSLYNSEIIEVTHMQLIARV